MHLRLQRHHLLFILGDLAFVRFKLCLEEHRMRLKFISLPQRVQTFSLTQKRYSSVYVIGKEVINFRYLVENALLLDHLQLVVEHLRVDSDQIDDDEEDQQLLLLLQIVQNWFVQKLQVIPQDIQSQDSRNFNLIILQSL